MKKLALSIAIIFSSPCFYTVLALSVFAASSVQTTATADEVEDQVEDEVEDQVEDEVEDQVEDEVEDQVEDEVEDQVEDEVEDQVEDDVEDQVEDDVEDQVEDDVEDMVEGDVEDRIENKDFERLIDQKIENAITDIIEDEQGALRIQGELLALGDEAMVDELILEGMIIKKTTFLEGLGKLLIEIEEPAKQNQDKTLFEYNHLYQESIDTSLKKTKGQSSAKTKALENIAELDPSSQGSPVNIGVIDSALDMNHPMFSSVDITTQSFIPKNQVAPLAHGTAVTSILLGRPERLSGLTPNSKLFCASVFFSTPEMKRHASVRSIVLALDWMIKSNVKVVNLSFSGPNNPLLEASIQHAVAKKLILFAAVGNNGPSARPVYPAAYKDVIAVTAVNDKNFAYFNANRGDYVDLAAPGVNIYHAKPDGQYGYSSGTSFAVPIVTALASRLKNQNPNSNIQQLLFERALDLGREGKDRIYGYGLVQPSLFLSKMNQSTKGI